MAPTACRTWWRGRVQVGPTRLVRANPAHPLFTPLSQIILATYGPPAVIAGAFREVPGVDAVMLFGSWAARYLGQPGRAPNDIDVLVIGSPDRDIVDDAVDRAEQTVRLPVQATIRSRSGSLGAVRDDEGRRYRPAEGVPDRVHDAAAVTVCI